MFGRPLAELEDAERVPMQRHEGGYYVRLTVADRPGAMAAIATRMGERRISLEAIMQKRPTKEAAAASVVPVILITHATTESAGAGSARPHRRRRRRARETASDPDRARGELGERLARAFSGGGSMKRWIVFLFHGPAWITFLAMGVFAALFGATSYNIARLFMANFDLVRDYGLMGLADGGLAQILELTVWGYLSLLFYILFKGCLYGLVDRFAKH